jgi:hypothetical protein
MTRPASSLIGTKAIAVTRHRAVPKNVAKFFAKWCTRGGPFKRFANPFTGFGHVPAAGLPEQFAGDVRVCKAKVLDGGAVGIDDSAFHVAMAGKQALIVNRHKFVVGLAELPVLLIEFPDSLHELAVKCRRDQGQQQDQMNVAIASARSVCATAGFPRAPSIPGLAMNVAAAIPV